MFLFHVLPSILLCLDSKQKHNRAHVHEHILVLVDGSYVTFMFSLNGGFTCQQAMQTVKSCYGYLLNLILL